MHNNEAGQVVALIAIGQKHCEEAGTIQNKTVLFFVHKFELNFPTFRIFPEPACFESADVHGMHLLLVS